MKSVLVLFFIDGVPNSSSQLLQLFGNNKHAFSVPYAKESSAISMYVLDEMTSSTRTTKKLKAILVNILEVYLTYNLEDKIAFEGVSTNRERKYN